MKDFLDLTNEECMDFLIKVVDIDEYEVKNFIDCSITLYDYGLINKKEASTLSEYLNRIYDILIKEYSSFPFETFKETYNFIKNIVENILFLKDYKLDFDIENVLKYAGV